MNMKRKKILTTVMLCFLLVASLFVMDKKEAHAAGNYWLQVNKGTNVVTVFRNDGTPERAFVCSLGSATPIGTFYTPNKYRWHELDGPSYGQYCTRITAGYLFHSVWYYRNGDYASQSYVQYNKLGTTASHGCVRLTVADAKWIYDNCPLGTRVTVMYGSSANDPLGKPAAIKVPNVREGWDPTDPAPGNPYSAAMPSINVSGANTSEAFGSDFNPLAGIVARDSLGNDISGRLAYAGSVNTRQLGDYRITYRVTDALGRTAYADVVYTVKDMSQASITGVKASLKKEYNSTLKLKKNVKAKTVTGTSLTNQIRIKIIYPKSKTEKTYKKSTLKLNKLGTYKINYYVTNPANGLETKVTCNVKVSDTKKPKFTGIKTKRTKEYKSTMNLVSGVKAKLVSGKNMTSKIVVKAKAPGQKSYKKLSSKKYKKYTFSKVGTYQIEYSVANPYNKKAVAKKVMKVTVKDTKKPVITGAADTNVEFGSKLNLKSGIKAKLVSGKTVTSSLKVKVITPKNETSEFTGTSYTFNQTGVYTIVYTAANPNNAKAVAEARRKITVTDTKAPAITGAVNKTVEFNGKLNLRAGITAKLVSGTDITSSLKVKVTTPGNVTSEFTGTEYTFNQTGAYTIVYTVANPSNANAAAEVSCKITVTDTQAPVIAGAEGRTVTLNDAVDLKAGVTAKLLSGTDVSSSLKVKVTTPQGAAVELAGPEYTYTFAEEGQYKVEYTAVNPNNPAAAGKAEITITVEKPQDAQEPKTQATPQDTQEPEAPVTPQDAQDSGTPEPQSEPEYMNPQADEPKQFDMEPQEEADNQVKDEPQEEAERPDRPHS